MSNARFRSNVSLILAMDLNRVIGVENRLPWQLPADLKRFKTLTMGHHIIMGRKTLESILGYSGGKLLPGRTSIVVTRQGDYKVDPACKRTGSIEEAIEAAGADSEIFVIGGAAIYKEALQYASKIYLTIVEMKVPHGDAYFSTLGPEWRVTEEENHAPDEKNRYSYRFQTLVRSC